MAATESQSTLDKLFEDQAIRDICQTIFNASYEELTDSLDEASVRSFRRLENDRMRASIKRGWDRLAPNTKQYAVGKLGISELNASIRAEPMDVDEPGDFATSTMVQRIERIEEKLMHDEHRRAESRDEDLVAESRLELERRIASNDLFLASLMTKTQAKEHFGEIKSSEKFLVEDVDMREMLARYDLEIGDFPQTLLGNFIRCLNDNETVMTGNFRDFAESGFGGVRYEGRRVFDTSKSWDDDDNALDFTIFPLRQAEDALYYMELKRRGATKANAEFQGGRYSLFGVLCGSRSHFFTIVVYGEQKFSLILVRVQDCMHYVEISREYSDQKLLARLFYTLFNADAKQLGVHRNFDRIRLGKSLGDGAEKYVFLGKDGDHAVVVKFWKRKERFDRARRIHGRLAVLLTDLENHCLDMPLGWNEHQQCAFFKYRLPCGSSLKRQQLKMFAEKLSHIHNRGIIHCDISLCNILVDPHTAAIMLTDCGGCRVPDFEEDKIVTKSGLFPEEYVRVRGYIDHGVDQIMLLRTIQDIRGVGTKEFPEWLPESELDGALSSQEFVDHVDVLWSACNKRTLAITDNRTAVRAGLGLESAEKEATGTRPYQSRRRRSSRIGSGSSSVTLHKKHYSKVSRPEGRLKCERCEH